MTSGQCEKIEFESTRHGTLTLIGNFQVTTGELIAPTIGPTRTEADFARHIEQTVATDPKASWIFVVDITPAAKKSYTNPKRERGIQVRFPRWRVG